MKCLRWSEGWEQIKNAQKVKIIYADAMHFKIKYFSWLQGSFPESKTYMGAIYLAFLCLCSLDNCSIFVGLEY